MIPKLRAWDKQDERMSYGEVEYFDDSINYRFDHFCTGADEDVEFMQSTGIKDKNGTDIYEGDIVNCMNKKFRIIFDDAEFRADGINIRLKKIVSHMEVIGNIWEDGELLEVTE